MLRYVILHHDGIPEPHFDLMFETSPNSALMTWRSPEWPITRVTKLEKLSDHRRAYLDYEGPVSGKRGFVKRVDSGNWRSSMNQDNPWVCDLWLNGNTHLCLVCSLANQWTIEP